MRYAWSKMLGIYFICILDMDVNINFFYIFSFSLFSSSIIYSLFIKFYLLDYMIGFFV